MILYIIFLISWFSNEEQDNTVRDRLRNNIDLINEQLIQLPEKYYSKWYHSTFCINKLSHVFYKFDVVLMNEEYLFSLTINTARIIKETMSNDPFMRPFLKEYPFLGVEVEALNYNHPDLRKAKFAILPYIASLHFDGSLQSKDKINMWTYVKDGKNNFIDNKYFLDTKTWNPILITTSKEKEN